MGRTKERKPTGYKQYFYQIRLKKIDINKQINDLGKNKSWLRTMLKIKKTEHYNDINKKET